MKIDWKFSSESEKAVIVSFTLIAALIFCAGFSRISWGGTISGGDDLALYTEAKNRDSLEKIFDPFFKKATIHTMTHYMPVSILEWSLLSSLFGKGGFGYHAVIFLLHILAAVLLFFVLRKLQCSRWAAYAGSALFLVFPLHINTINWIAAGTRHPLSAVLLLLTLFFFIEYLNKRKPHQYLLAFVFFVLGVLLIQSFYLLFPILIGLEFWVFREKNQAKKISWRALAKHLPFIFTAVSLFLLSLVRFDASFIARFNGGLPLTPVVFFRLGDFAKEVVWPFMVQDFWVRSGLILAIFLLALAILVWEKQKIPRFWIGFIVAIGIFMVLQNLRPLPETIRYTYLLSIGCFAIVAHYFDRPNLAFKVIPIALGAIYLLAL